MDKHKIKKHIDKANACDLTVFLEEQGLLTEEESDSLINIINSDDNENFIIAEIILTQKQYGINLPRKKS